MILTNCHNVVLVCYFHIHVLDHRIRKKENLPWNISQRSILYGRDASTSRVGQNQAVFKRNLATHFYTNQHSQENTATS